MTFRTILSTVPFYSMNWFNGLTLRGSILVSRVLFVLLGHGSSGAILERYLVDRVQLERTQRWTMTDDDVCVVTQRIEWTIVSMKHDLYRNTKEIIGAHTRFWTRRSVYWSIVMVPSESCFFSASLPDCSHCSLMVVEGGGYYSLFEVSDEDCGGTPVFLLYIDWCSRFRGSMMICKCVSQYRKYLRGSLLFVCRHCVY